MGKVSVTHSFANDANEWGTRLDALPSITLVHSGHLRACLRSQSFDKLRLDVDEPSYMKIKGKVLSKLFAAVICSVLGAGAQTTVHTVPDTTHSTVITTRLPNGKRSVCSKVSASMSTLGQTKASTSGPIFANRYFGPSS